MNRKLFFIMSLMIVATSVANESNEESDILEQTISSAESKLQWERCREEKSSIASVTGLDSLAYTEAATRKAVPKEFQAYKKYKSLYFFQRRLFKPNQEEYDEIREAAYAAKDRELINELEGNGIQSHSVFRELATTPFTFAWNNRKAVVCIAIGACIAGVSGNVQGKREGFENGKKVASPCKYAVYTKRSTVLCTNNTPHTHTLHRTSPGFDSGSVTLTND